MSTTLFGSNDEYLKRVEAGLANGTVMADAGGNTPLGPSVSLTNLGSSGALGTAAATVDISSFALLNQTSASKVFTLPTPTTTSIPLVYQVINTGSQAFTMYNVSVATGTGLAIAWSGSAWYPLKANVTTTTTTTTTL